MITKTCSARKSTFIEIIPDAQEVRDRLGQTLREARILRQLLKVSEKAEFERRQQREVPHAR